MSWFKKGEEAIRAQEKNEKVAQLMREKRVPWFRLKPDEEAEVIIVDDDPFWCEIHTVQVAGRWMNLTCSEGVRPCRVCQHTGKKGQGTTFYTVIDLRSYTRDDGTVVKATKKLLPAKRTLAKQIIDLKRKHKDLVGLMIRLKRFTATDAACGIVTEVISRVKLSGEWAIPFDYEKVLAPPTEEELEALGFTITVTGDSPLDDIDDEFEEQELPLDEEEEELEVEEETVEEIVEEEKVEEEKPKKKKRVTKKKTAKKEKTKERAKKPADEVIDEVQNEEEAAIEEAEELLGELEEELEL